MNKHWTVGMAVFDSGPPYPESVRARFTAMSLLVHHRENIHGVVVVDNNPLPDNPVRELEVKTGGLFRYVPMPEPQGTSPPRNQIFAEATTEYVACIDPHVLLRPGFFDVLDEFYKSRPGSLDLLHGPIVSEIGLPFATHMNDQWRSEMWGTWGTAWQHPSGFLFSVLTRDDKTLEYVSLDPTGEQVALNHKDYGLPDLNWPGHEVHLRQLGCVHPNKPFPVPGAGMGFFACRKDAWLPFHPDARGFGGEEMTTGVRYRLAGRKCWCVPGADWWHDFSRPSGSPYRLTVWDKVRNYVLEFTRLGMSLGPIREHFVPHRMPPAEWDQLVSGVSWPLPRVNVERLAPRPIDMPPDQFTPTGVKGPCAQVAVVPLPQTLESLYESALSANNDFAPDAPILRNLCTGAGRVVAILPNGGLRAAATLLAPGVKSLTLYTNARAGLPKRMIPEGCAFSNVVGEVNGTPECDLLIADLGDDASKVLSFLSTYFPKVSRRIVVRGTSVPDKVGGTLTATPAVRGFLMSRREWTSIARHPTRRGLTVLSRDDADKRQPPGLLRKALNLGLAVTKHVASGLTPTAESERKARVETCIMCPHRTHDLCSLCGCPVDKKAAWSEEKCPDNPPRWS